MTYAYLDIDWIQIPDRRVFFEYVTNGQQKDVGLKFQNINKQNTRISLHPATCLPITSKLTQSLYKETKCPLLQAQFGAQTNCTVRSRFLQRNDLVAGLQPYFQTTNCAIRGFFYSRIRRFGNLVHLSLYRGVNVWFKIASNGV